MNVGESLTKNNRRKPKGTRHALTHLQAYPFLQPCKLQLFLQPCPSFFACLDEQKYQYDAPEVFAEKKWGRGLKFSFCMQQINVSRPKNCSGKCMKASLMLSLSLSHDCHTALAFFSSFSLPFMRCISC
jgi:hypothetical protein